MRGKITIHQGPDGRCRGVFLDGQRLPHARGYRILNSVDAPPTVMIEFRATTEIFTDVVPTAEEGHPSSDATGHPDNSAHDGHRLEDQSSVTEDYLWCHDCGELVEK